MSSLFDPQQSQYPWLGRQLAQPSPLDLQPQPQRDEHFDSNASAAGSRPSVTAPTRPARAEDATSSDDPMPQAPKSNATAEFWRSLLQTLGARHPIAAVLGSIGTARQQAKQGQYTADRQAWQDRQKTRTDQSMIDYRKAEEQRQIQLANKKPDPMWKMQGYTVAGSKPAPGAQGPVSPDYSGSLAFNEHGDEPPKFPEGAVLTGPKREDLNRSPYEDAAAAGMTPEKWLDTQAAATERHRRPERDVTPNWTPREVEDPNPKDPDHPGHHTEWFNAHGDAPPSGKGGKFIPPKAAGKASKQGFRDFVMGGATPGGTPPPPAATPAPASAAKPQAAAAQSYVTKDGKLKWDGSGWVPNR